MLVLSDYLGCCWPVAVCHAKPKLCAVGPVGGAYVLPVDSLSLLLKSLPADLLGFYHCEQGVVKALFENGLLPKVLSGSSVGSISAPSNLLNSLHYATVKDNAACAFAQDQSTSDMLSAHVAAAGIVDGLPSLALVQSAPSSRRATTRSWLRCSRPCTR